MTLVNSVSALISKADADNIPSKDLLPDLKALLQAATNETPAQRDTWIYRAVVTILGSVAIITVIGGIGLAFFGDSNAYKIPSEMVAIGSAAVGALAGLLAPSPSAKATSG